MIQYKLEISTTVIIRVCRTMMLHYTRFYSIFCHAYRGIAVKKTTNYIAPQLTLHTWCCHILLMMLPMPDAHLLL